MSLIYHRTSASPAILRDGFRDSTGHYMIAGLTLTGVWVSDQPLDCNEGAHGDDLLCAEASLSELDEFEVIEDGKPYREWCVPASILNQLRWTTIRDEADEPLGSGAPSADGDSLRRMVKREREDGS